MMTAVLPLISPEKGMQLGFIAQGLMLVVSGVYYSVEVLPEWMQWISKISPATYALRGIRDAILNGGGLAWARRVAAARDRSGLGPARPADLPLGRALCEAARKAQAVGVIAVPEDHFGEEVAAWYDESSADMFEPAVVGPVVDFLADLAGEGAALELGIGTGRIALPLAQRGVRVHGIDLSTAMVARLRAKPGAENVGVTIGDFARTTVDGTFSLAYLVFNTINNLTTQAEQVACFRNVASHLEPGGCFVIEVGVPALRRLPPGQRFVPFDVSPDASRLRRVRRRQPGAGLASLRAARRPAGIDAVPVRVAVGARPDGAHRGDDAARALERLEARAVHEREHEARLGLGDGRGVRRVGAERLYYALELLLSMPTWVVVSVYLVNDLHLTPLQLVLMGTAMEATVFLCEIPTGVVADTYSRRLSLIIGYLGMGAAWMLVGVFSAPWAIIALWAFWGLAYTFTSGADRAWIADEVGPENVGRIFLKGARIGYVGSVAGLLGLVALGTVSLRASVIAGGAITFALRHRLHLPHARDRLPAPAARRARLRPGRAADDRRERRALRLGGARDHAARRRRDLHGDVERGLRPVEGSALPARRRASGRR